ncbi:hypothetical protein AAG906_005023 [Vitis piasezkii]
MPVTRSGNSYAMANTQNTNDQNPNSQNTNQPQLQHQIDQIATVLEQITHRLDVMDERYAERNMGPSIERRERFEMGKAYQPLDELTKRMRVDVPDFFGKSEPNAFEDWLTAIEDRKVRYVRMKLKGMHEHGGEVWKNNYADTATIGF